MTRFKIFLVAAVLSISGSASLAQDCFIGEVRGFAGNFAPRNWAFTSGQVLAIGSYQALFSILGTTYGGDGRTTFALPDLRGRAAIHTGQGAGLTPVQIGNRFGNESNVIGINNLPSHSHSLNATSADGSQTAPAGHILADDGSDRIYSQDAPDVTMNAAAIGPTGGNQPIDNRPPSLGLNHIICLEGYYPSRS